MCVYVRRVLFIIHKTWMSQHRTARYYCVPIFRVDATRNSRRSASSRNAERDDTRLRENHAQHTHTRTNTSTDILPNYHNINQGLVVRRIECANNVAAMRYDTDMKTCARACLAECVTFFVRWRRIATRTLCGTQKPCNANRIKSAPKRCSCWSQHKTGFHASCHDAFLCRVWSIIGKRYTNTSLLYFFVHVSVVFFCSVCWSVCLRRYVIVSAVTHLWYCIIAMHSHWRRSGGRSDFECTDIDHACNNGGRKNPNTILRLGECL